MNALAQSLIDRLSKEDLVKIARANADTVSSQQREYGEEINRLHGEIRDLKSKLAAAEESARIFKTSLDEKFLDRMLDEPRPSLCEPDYSGAEARAIEDGTWR